MQIQYETFWALYPHMVSLLMPPLQPGDGATGDEIAAAETRLGFRLPALLREFYARTSRREDINAAHNRLVNLDELEELDNGYLVFYVENQEVVLFGIELGTETDDPPVWIRSNDPGVAWEPLYDSLSLFLAFTLLQQVCMGDVLPAVGEGSGTKAEYDAATENWEHISAGYDRGAVKQGAAVMFFEPAVEGSKGVIWAGCTELEDARTLEEQFEVVFVDWPFEEE